MTDGFKQASAMIDRDEKPGHCDEHGDFTSHGYKIGRNWHWMSCPECSKIKQARADAEMAARQAEEEQQRLEARLSKAGIPLRYRSRTFDTFEADTEGKEKALAVARDFAENFDEHYRNGSVVVFSGLPGTGKSHLAIAIAQAIMDTHTALYTSAIDAVRMVRDTWRKDSPRTEREMLDILASLGLLILDEVGVQYGTDAEQVTLFDIIDKRYRDMMPIILLTNLNKSGMKEFLGERSFDRLREGGQWVTFDWQSHRGNAR
jgi:DNA replication protein DnaC